MVEDSCIFLSLFYFIFHFSRFRFSVALFLFSFNFLDLGIALKCSFELVFLYKIIFFITVLFKWMIESFWSSFISVLL